MNGQNLENNISLHLQNITIAFRLIKKTFRWIRFDLYFLNLGNYKLYLSNIAISTKVFTNTSKGLQFTYNLFSI